MFTSVAKTDHWQDPVKPPINATIELNDDSQLSPPLPRSSVDAHQVLGSVVRECQARIGSKGLQVSLRLLSRQYHISDDGERLRQVYLNLLNNAVSAARPGAKITLRATCPSDCALRIEVEERSPWRAKLQAADPVPTKKKSIPPRGHR